MRTRALPATKSHEHRTRFPTQLDLNANQFITNSPEFITKIAHVKSCGTSTRPLPRSNARAAAWQQQGFINMRRSPEISVAADTSRSVEMQ